MTGSDCHSEEGTTEKSASIGIQIVMEKDISTSLHCAQYDRFFLFVISMDVGLRNLLQKEFKVLMKRCFPSRCSVLHGRLFCFILSYNDAKSNDIER